jgi:site-specific recombinase XerD
MIPSQGLPDTVWVPCRTCRKEEAKYVAGGSSRQPWLFPSYRGRHTSGRQLHRIVRLAAGRAGIVKRVGVHTLRPRVTARGFAKHLLEQKTDIRVIQRCYGASGERTALSSLQQNRRGAPCHNRMT